MRTYLRTNEKYKKRPQIPVHLSRRLRPQLKTKMTATGRGEILNTRSAKFVTDIKGNTNGNKISNKRKVQNLLPNTRSSFPKTPAPIKDEDDGNRVKEKFYKRKVQKSSTKYMSMILSMILSKNEKYRNHRQIPAHPSRRLRP